MAEILAKIDCEKPQVSVKSNLASVKEQLEVLLKGFEAKDYPTLKEAKAARATLNKVFDALEEERKRAHEIIEAPYKDFLPQYDLAVARLKECMVWISARCKAMEEKAKPKQVLEKTKVVFTFNIDLDERSKIEKWLLKNGFEYKVK